ncbi:hypothetical protein [Helicobacter pylori]|uniref:hypothetical protein n=1 Tax=Helicobacter pylori TaxID=210 RepID=UPI00095820B0|nr:hypothetical protein [Helicobacter pylori]BAW45485.1 putative uncharacterized protein [Helicobacter pylori]BAW50039.1 putative uncharacterized protein [Helicobacter pylori]BAW59330.1 putative uncharacterized protein [Helicobacter pylori]BAW67403.1 putative uncharacterized protein [Helicobacter pylori]BCJ02925.1 hypothetical protein JSHR6_08200 [Helicobacter pylori]
MDKKRDGHAIVSNVIKSLESGDSFSPRDREKFARVAREHGIEGSVIEEVIDIAQTISLTYRHEDWLDRSDLEREKKKAMRAKFIADFTRSMFPLNGQKMVMEILNNHNKMMEVLNNYNNKDGSR